MNIKDYIQGKRHGKEANQLERKAMNDPFLQDAIDGFDNFPGDHLSVINALEKQIKRSENKKSVKFRNWIVGIAASIFLLLSIDSLMRFNKQNNKEFAHQTIQHLNKEIEEKNVSDELVEKRKLNEKIITQNRLKENSEIKKAKQTVENRTNNEIAIEVQSDEQLKEMTLVAEEEIQKNDVQQVARTSTNKAKIKKVIGKVVDEEGKPLMGASLKLNGVFVSSISDSNGNFEMEVPNGNADKIIASYVGYEKKEIPISSDSNIIRLQPDNLALNEVVVVGYGAQKRSSVVGSVSSVKSVPIKFGEAEFEKYIKNNHPKNLCNEKTEYIKIAFSIDEFGKPVNLEIVECTCVELENEFVQLFKNSPRWTTKFKRVKLTIRF